MAVRVTLVFVRCAELFYPRAQLRGWRGASPNGGFVIRVFPGHPCGGRKENPLLREIAPARRAAPSRAPEYAAATRSAKNGLYVVCVAPPNFLTSLVILSRK